MSSARRSSVVGLLLLTLTLLCAEGLLRLLGFHFGYLYVHEAVFLDRGDGLLETNPMFTDPDPYGFPFCLKQQFRREKGERAFRVILVGESSVYRLGHAPELAEELGRVLQKDVEVVNGGFQALGSDRALLTFREAVKYSPDVIVVYVGHNEFLGLGGLERFIEGGPAAPAPAWNRDIRMLQLFAKIRYRVAPPSRSSLSTYLPAYRPEEKEKNYRRFESNLRRMVALAREANIPVILATVSYNYVAPPLFGEGADDATRLNAQSDEALFLDQRQRPNNSYTEHAIGWRAYQRGEYAEAKLWFDRAFLDDSRPFRASTRINDIVRRVSLDTGCELADVYREVAVQAPHGLPDASLFDDVCHLNGRGNEILQATVARAILRLPAAAPARPRSMQRGGPTANSSPS